MRRIVIFMIYCILFLVIDAQTYKTSIVLSAAATDTSIIPVSSHVGGDDYSISGRIRANGTDLPNITVRLYLQSAPTTPIQTTVTSKNGTFQFTNLSNNTYYVRPANPSYDFDPAERSVVIFFGNVSNVDFTAVLRKYDVNGAVKDNGTGLPNVIVRLYELPNTTTAIRSSITDSQGNYLFPDVVPGTYRAVPENVAYNFIPTFRDFSVTTAPVALVDFEANINTYNASGRVSDKGTGLVNVTLTLAPVSNPGQILATVTTNGNGDYRFQDIEPGSYRIMPTLDDYTIVPDYRDFVISNADVETLDFEADSNVFDASGRILDNGIPLIQMQVQLSRQSDPETPMQFEITDANGNYSFEGIDPGDYRVTPVRAGYRFTPTFRNFSITTSSISWLNFEGDLVATPTPTATGTHTPIVQPTASPTTTPTSIVQGPTATSTVTLPLSEGVYIPLVLRNLAYATPPAPTLTPTTTPVLCLAGDLEPNNLYLDADNNLALCAGSTLSGAVARANDVNDIYRIEVSGSAAPIQITLTNMPPDADYDLYLDAGPGQNLAYSTNGGNATESITHPLPAGRYYLRVVVRRDGNPNSYQLRWIR